MLWRLHPDLCCRPGDPLPVREPFPRVLWLYSPESQKPLGSEAQLAGLPALAVLRRLLFPGLEFSLEQREH